MSNDFLDLGDIPKAPAERLKLVLALLERADLRTDAMHALHLRYSHLPEEVLHTAAHHLYGDLPDALVDMLALLELSLRSPHREVGYGASLHLLDHLYNWFQIQALLPHGIHELDALAAEAEAAIGQGDTTEALAALQELRKRIDGDLSAPKLE